jgi:DNA-binding NarL/FixJ family response regulator
MTCPPLGFAHVEGVAAMSGDLSGQDVEKLAMAMSDIAEPCPLPELRQRSLEAVRDMVPALHIAWNELNLTTGVSEILLIPEYDEWPSLNDDFMRLAPEHPLISYHARTGDGRPFKISDFMTVDEFHATELYQTIYRRLNAEDQMAFVLPSTSILLGIALNRDSRSFSDRDRSMLNLYRPHLLQAYRNALVFGELQDVLKALDALTAPSGDGVVILDAAGGISHVTENAVSLLNKWFGFKPGNRLPDDVADWLGHLSSLANAVPPWPLVVDREKRQLVLRVLPAVANNPAAITVVERGRVVTPPSTFTALGLTEREANVLARVGDGETNAMVADGLSISVRTVEKHLQHVYDKLGVDNRTAAVNLVSQMEKQNVK